MNIYVVSDLHFNDKLVVDFEREQFSSIEEHNEYIIEHFNSIVLKDDLTYFLGDLGFGDVKKIRKLVKRLNGRKILIYGNHDQFSISDAYDMGFDEVHVGPMFFSENIIFSHEPVLEAYKNPYVINVHGHLHNSDLKEKNYFNVNIARTNYIPVNVSYFVSFANNHCIDRRENFGKEWYHEYYQFDPGKEKRKKC